MKRLALILMVVAAFAFAAFADGPPAPPNPIPGGAGWGMCLSNWDWVNGTQWSSNLTIYNPNGPGGGAGWVTGFDGSGNPIYINYADITLDLWIEMSCIQTYWNTAYKWHRLGQGPECVDFDIQGWLGSNDDMWVSLAGYDTLANDPRYLHYLHSIGVGNNDPSSLGQRELIPITWTGRWGTGNVPGAVGTQIWPPTGYGTLVWSPPQILFPEQIPPCTHWYEFHGHFCLELHEADGHWSLTLEGCPAPGL